MKKKIISLTLATLMVVATITGCGKDTPKNETTNNETNVESTTETPTPDTNVSVDENVEIVEVEYSYDSSWVFPEGTEGFTDKYVSESKPDWSLNRTHYVAKNGTEMNFEWEGPLELGKKAGGEESTLVLGGLDYELSAWNGGPLELAEIEECYNLDKDTWVTLSGSATYVENGYYNVEKVENIVYVTYEVSTDDMQGYAYYICNGDAGNYYMFVYLENKDVYDETRAMKVLDSISYWDYVPEN